jgi:O-antigen/teichoic acid export membrane protein
VKRVETDSALKNQIPVALGTLIYIVCGIAVAILASKSLSADNYVNYSAFVSVGGIFVLGIGAAIEQETNLIYFRSDGNSYATWRFMFPRVVFAVLVLWLIVLTPVFTWQANLFGESSTEVQLAVALGLPGLLLAGVARGIVNGRADYRRLALAHLIFGLGTIALPVLLWSLGVSLLVALVTGQAIAWSLPLLALLRKSLFHNQQLVKTQKSTSNLSGWLVLANIALLTNLLSSQLIFRLHSGLLSSTVVAEAQILITVSCFASTLALGLMPQIIANHRRRAAKDLSNQQMIKVGVLLFAAVLSLGTALFRQIIAVVLLPRKSVIPFIDALLITTPAIFLVLTLLMSGKLIAEEKARQAAVSWVLGLVGLWLVPELSDSQNLRSFTIALFLGATVAPISFLSVNFWQRRH